MTEYKDVMKCGEYLRGYREYAVGSWNKFSGWLPLMKIHEYWTNPEIIAISDGFGKPGYQPPDGDWSGIRDSSPEAIRKMEKVAERLQGNKPWPWENAIEIECVCMPIEKTERV